jgi:hypothetical protein
VEAPFRIPAEWLPGPVHDLVGAPLAPEEVPQARRALEAAMDRYPAGFLGANLSLVVVFRSLEYNGLSPAGTYLFDQVYLAAGEYPAGEPRDIRIAQIFHHEVSSILLHRHRHLFDEARFRAANFPGFVYTDEADGADPVLAVNRQHTAAGSTPSLPELAWGFLVPYARTHVEQDFNTYAEILLWRPDLLLNLFAPDSPVGRKARVVRDFYIAIDKRFEAVLTPRGG